MSSSNAPAAKSAHKKRSKEHVARGGDQVFLTLVIWLFPLALFTYVAFKVAVATGHELPLWVVNFDVRQAAIVIVATFMVMGAIAVSLPVIRARRRSDRWDGKTSPGHISGK